MAGVYLARTADISGTVFLGDGTVVGEQSRICSSVIGRNCVIGRDVVLSHCCLWDNVKVGDGARLQGTIACDGAAVGRDVAVPQGCVLGFQVSQVKPGQVKSSQVKSRVSAGGAGAGCGGGSVFEVLEEPEAHGGCRKRG